MLLSPPNTDAAAMYRQYGMTPKVTAADRGVRPKFVKFAPGDKGEHLPDAFFEDPRTFQPKPGMLGQIHCWGIFPYDIPEKLPSGRPIPEDAKNWPDFDGLMSMLRQMNHQMRYTRIPSPEKQFMSVLLDRKKKQLKNLDLKGLEKCDVICKITLSGVPDSKGEPRIWRRFKVSAGISIQALQDKVIAPLMGWVRNLHCYTFTDFRDGSLFGPEYSTSVDSVHIANVGHDYLPDHKYKFAHLFGKEGDEVGYLYDFGDRWHHCITIEKIIPAGESTGAIEVIDGKGMCPGENMDGSIKYGEFLFDYEQATPSQKAKMKREVLEQPNYKKFGKPPALFDPFKFDIDEAKARVQDALNTSSSVPSGAKEYLTPMGAIQPEMFGGPEGLTFPVMMKNDDGSRGFWQEFEKTTKDSRKVAKPVIMQFKIATAFTVAAVLSATPVMAATAQWFAGADCTGTLLATSNNAQGAGCIFLTGGVTAKSIRFTNANLIRFFISGGQHDNCSNGPHVVLSTGSGCETAPPG
ncbi:hypothetical protein CVT24_012244 [Panaeolus cyanescens]|uniref:Plasmid pRiA4b Orf3-like domain-containing protein n=1 Tax=Panaeolus cyanescens TaxID=181874 RepID=A0A409W5S2_9AGAR|nr:hypothetical protein CVT24_012244 [Panaeolus cyanescens]